MCQSKRSRTLVLEFLALTVTLIHLDAEPGHAHAYAHERAPNLDNSELLDESTLEKWWNHETQLSQAYNFSVRWNNLDSEWLTMEMSAGNLSGGDHYVALGFSKDGRMKGADMVLGYLDTTIGEPHLMDLHGVGHSAPVQDGESNYELLSGSHSNDLTTLKFRRKWNTRDRQDFMLTDDTAHIMWAVGLMKWDANEIGQEMNTKPLYLYHEVARGSRPVYIKSNNIGWDPPPPLEEEHLGPNIDVWDFQPENNIDGESTVYTCGLIKMPYVKGQQRHIIGFRPLLGPEDGYRIHHMLFFGCLNVPRVNDSSDETIFDKFIGLPSRNFFTHLPVHWLEYCRMSAVVWAIGGEGYLLPNVTGIPIGEEPGSFKYLIYQIHFDNPHHRKFVDHTGGRFYLSKPGQPRETATALGTIVHRVSLFHVLPPQTESYSVSTFCAKDCLANILPSDGVTVTQVMLHAHETASKMRFRHTRGGVELPPLAVDENYSPWYQEFKNVYPPRKLLPGDELIMECTYDTRERNNVTLGGIEASTEMCAAFLYFYPQAPFFCVSQPEFYSFFNAIGVDGHNVGGDGLKWINQPYEFDHEKGIGPNVSTLDDVIALMPYTKSIGFRDALDFFTIDKESKSAKEGAGERSSRSRSTVSFREYFNHYDWGNGAQDRIYDNEQYLFCEGNHYKNVSIFLPEKILQDQSIRR